MKKPDPNAVGRNAGNKEEEQIGEKGWEGGQSFYPHKGRELSIHLTFSNHDLLHNQTHYNSCFNNN